MVEDAGVRATTTLTIRNTSPDQYLTDSVVSFYWDEFGIPVPAGAQNVQATSEGGSLQVQIEPTEDPSTAIAVASFRPLNYGQSRTIEWSYTIPGAPFRAADWTRVGPGLATFAAQGVGDPGDVGVVVIVPASMTFHSTGSFAERREGDVTRRHAAAASLRQVVDGRADERGRRRPGPWPSQAVRGVGPGSKPLRVLVSVLRWMLATGAGGFGERVEWADGSR